MPGNPRPRTVARRPARPISPRGSPVARRPAPARSTVTGVTHASGEVRPGDLYAALPGARRHGAEFVAGAAAAGAVAVLTDPAGAAAAPRRPGCPCWSSTTRAPCSATVASAVYGDPTARLTVIGITGTAGKTSTAYLVESGLRAAGHVTGLIGTVETRLGDLVIDSVRTTPEATDLHALFAAAPRARGHRGGDGGVQPRAGAWAGSAGSGSPSAATPTSAWTTSTSTPTSDDYFAAKARLFDGRCAVEVLNLDDPALRPLLQAGDGHLLGGRRPGGDLAGRRRRPATASRQRFTAHGPDGVAVAGRRRAARPAQRRQRAARARRLVAVGVDPATAADGIAACPGVPGRLELVDAPGAGARRRRLRAQARRDRGRARRAARAGRGPRRPADLRHRRRRRPGPGQAAADGRGRRPRRRPGAGHRRQPAHRGPGARSAPRCSPGAERAGAAAGSSRSPAGGPRSPRRSRLAEPGDVIAVLGKGHERGQEVAGEVLAVRRPGRAGRRAAPRASATWRVSA